MKILYDDTIFSLQKYGGISRYFSEVMPRIKKYNGVEVSVFKRLGRKLTRFNNLIMDYQLNLSKFDIYHPTYYSNTVKKRRNVKTVVTVFDMIHELYLYPIKIHRDGIPVKKQSIMNADHIICISENTKRDLRKIYNIKDEKISVIYLGKPEGLTIPSKNINQLLSKPYILYAGNRSFPYKNFKTLLKALSLLRENNLIKLICVGGGKFTKEELSEFKKINVAGAINYLEFSDEILQPCYANAIALIYPSLYEGFGIPILEAMTFGCPVIASNVASIPEVGGDAALLFSPDSPEELSNCIRKIINDDVLRNEYIEKGKIRCKEFSWDKTAVETFNVYKKING